MGSDSSPPASCSRPSLPRFPAATTLASGLLPGLEANTALLVLSVALIGATTLAYTLLGGMMAVIWTDVIQLVVYLGGTAFAAVILLGEIPGGWAEVVAVAGPAQKLKLFDFTWDLTRSYTFWSGVVGGIFLTAATHGTDQLFVQRYLCSRSVSEARRALVVSGAVILVQFALFLVIGTMLWVYYTGYAPEALSALMVDGQVQTDRVFPTFIMSHLPTGVRGLVVAAIVAAAMSTLSSSLNSSAASTVGDFYMPWTGSARSDRHYLAASRWATIGWGGVQLTVAIVAIELSSRVVDEVLGIQSFHGRADSRCVLAGILHDTLGRRTSSRSCHRSRCVVCHPSLHRRFVAVVRFDRVVGHVHGWLVRRPSHLETRAAWCAMTQFDEAGNILAHGARSRAFACAVVEVGRRDGVLWQQAFGTPQWRREVPRRAPSTPCST